MSNKYDALVVSARFSGVNVLMENGWFKNLPISSLVIESNTPLTSMHIPFKQFAEPVGYLHIEILELVGTKRIQNIVDQRIIFKRDDMLHFSPLIWRFHAPSPHHLEEISIPSSSSRFATINYLHVLISIFSREGSTLLNFLFARVHTEILPFSPTKTAVLLKVIYCET